MEPIHEFGEAFVKLATPGLDLVQSKVDTRVDIKEEAAEPRLPGAAVLVIVEEVAQGTPWAKSDLRRDGTVQPCVSLVADRLALNYGVIITRCTKIEKLVQGFAIPHADAGNARKPV
jgi:hypothetical protein